MTQQILASAQPLAAPQQSAPIGRIVGISGSTAQVELSAQRTGDDSVRVEMGAIMKVTTPFSVVIGIVAGLSSPRSGHDGGGDVRLAKLELVGELTPELDENDASRASFRRGVSIFPTLDDAVFSTGSDELALIYRANDKYKVRLGALHQDPSIPANALTEKLLSKHFAILGTTGTGKSCTTALLLRGILFHHQNAHIVLLDPHNEYHSTFGARAERIDQSSLEIPYWLLNQEEVIEVLAGNDAHRDAEIDILNELIPEAKRLYQSGGARVAVQSARRVRQTGGVSVDTPSPYRLSDLLRLMDQEMGQLDRPRELMPYKHLKNRIENLQNDARYSFMFGTYQVSDRMSEILGRIFRIPVDGKPLTILDLSGVPAEILNVVVSVIGRLAFDLAVWSEKAVPITLVCEEAHRYIPAASGLGFEPAKRALGRIAKEGRKYGVSLGLVTQRPSELCPTILSQCNTVFSLRMSNKKDQDFVSAALSDSSGSLLDCLPALGDGEAIAVGEGVTMPMRVRFDQLPQDAVPHGKAGKFTEAWNDDVDSAHFLTDVIASWRHQREEEPTEV